MSESKKGCRQAPGVIHRIFSANRFERRKTKMSKKSSDEIINDSNTVRSVQTHSASKGEQTKNGISRRKFVKGAVTVATVAAAVPLQSVLGGKETTAQASVVQFKPKKRTERAFQVRLKAAQKQRIDVGLQADNGDAARFPDGSANFTKALKHDALGVPNAAAFASLRNALSTGEAEDFAKILVGTPGGGPNSKLNGPQVALAFDLEGLDSHATLVDPAPSVASAEAAAEEVEHYWAALTRDVPFNNFDTDPTIAAAVADLNNLSFIKSSANDEFPFPVTTQNIFRGQIVKGDGNVQGPRISQFFVQPTSFGAQAISQKFQHFQAGQAFMTSPAEFELIQNGGDSGRQLLFDADPQYIHDGRGLASWTHVDVLFQGYFIAFLVLAGINAPANPGTYYPGKVTEKGFATLGPPDAAGTLCEMATRALKGVWFHKWIKDLRLRPEEYAGLVQARLTGTTPQPQAAAALHPDVLNSAALPRIFSQFGSFLMPQAFPEGCPTHPCYPTGHGTVGGASITALKFFFDGTQKIRPLLLAAGSDVMVPTSDGLNLTPYTGADRDELTINGELVKLAFNVTQGHGIYAGIHFRSSSKDSVMLGEQVALSVLRDRANTYSEPFSVNITKLDGTVVTISNNPGDVDANGEDKA
jgi:hypothetical protein